jgi:hypothetical protein
MAHDDGEHHPAATGQQPHETTTHAGLDLPGRDAERERLVRREHVEQRQWHSHGPGQDGLGLRIARLVHEA